MEDFNFLDTILTRARIVESRVENNIIKKKVKTTQGGKNIAINVLKTGEGDYAISVLFRDSLKFVDMGAGPGYEKGRKVNPSTRKSKVSGRKPKKITNRTVWGFFHFLEELGTINFLEVSESQITASFKV